MVYYSWRCESVYLPTTIGGNTMYRPCDTGFGFAYWRYWCGSQFWRGRIRGVILCAWVGQLLFGLCAFLLCVQNRSKSQRIEEVKMMKRFYVQFYVQFPLCWFWFSAYLLQRWPIVVVRVWLWKLRRMRLLPAASRAITQKFPLPIVRHLSIT